MKLTGIASEAFNAADEAGARLDECWEAAAQAVRAAVIEECAEKCRTHGKNFNWGSENADRYHIQAEWSDELARLLRSLK